MSPRLYSLIPTFVTLTTLTVKHFFFLQTQNIHDIYVDNSAHFRIQGIDTDWKKSQQKDNNMVLGGVLTTVSITLRGRVGQFVEACGAHTDRLRALLGQQPSFIAAGITDDNTAVSTMMLGMWEGGRVSLTSSVDFNQ